MVSSFEESYRKSQRSQVTLPLRLYCTASCHEAVTRNEVIGGQFKEFTVELLTICTGPVELEVESLGCRLTVVKE